VEDDIELIPRSVGAGDAAAEIARVERAIGALRTRMVETDARIGAPGVVASFERLLTFEAWLCENDGLRSPRRR
jgi:hypothetical protein